MVNQKENGVDKSKAGTLLAFDSITFWVGNAKQTASFYCSRFGFEPLAYKGLETGCRKFASHVVQQNDIIFVFESAYESGDEHMAEYLSKHGDSIRDVSFRVEDIDSVVRIATEQGAKLVKGIWEERDELGVVRMATIQTFGNTLHTLVDRTRYTGKFLPGYKPAHPDSIATLLPKTGLCSIDHCVGSQPANEMECVAKWYEKCLQFHRSHLKHGSLLQTEFSAFRQVVVTNDEETIRMVINEPAPGKKRSQIQEFIEYFGGPGVQHIAFNTSDIITTVKNLKARGLEFIDIPDEYYDKLRENLLSSETKVLEDISVLQHLKILVDYDDKGYLLQTFTKPVQDRPTTFMEVIQRRNHDGFGIIGNIKALFVAIETEQAKRGNL